MDLAAEVRRQFRVKTVIVTIVFGALGTISAKLSESLEIMEIEKVDGTLQTAVLISTTAILREVLGLEVNKYLSLCNILKQETLYVNIYNIYIYTYI